MWEARLVAESRFAGGCQVLRWGRTVAAMEWSAIGGCESRDRLDSWFCSDRYSDVEKMWEIGGNNEDSRLVANGAIGVLRHESIGNHLIYKILFDEEKILWDCKWQGVRGFPSCDFQAHTLLGSRPLLRNSAFRFWIVLFIFLVSDWSCRPLLALASGRSTTRHSVF